MAINQQPSWGGKRKGSGAPMGNTNAVKHGERSRQAFFPLVVPEHFTSTESNRARNLILAKRWAELYAMNPPPRTEHYSEMMLINGLMGQHTDRIITQTMKLKKELSTHSKSSSKLEITDLDRIYKI